MSEKDRFDFLLDGGIVLEAKIDGSFGDAWRQIARYLEHGTVRAVALVTAKRWDVGRLRKEQRGKRFEVIQVKRRAF